LNKEDGDPGKVDANHIHRRQKKRSEGCYEKAKTLLPSALPGCSLRQQGLLAPTHQNWFMALKYNYKTLTLAASTMQ
jgi:hypothetical protein